MVPDRQCCLSFGCPSLLPTFTIAEDEGQDHRGLWSHVGTIAVPSPVTGWKGLPHPTAKQGELQKALCGTAQEENFRKKRWCWASFMSMSVSLWDILPLITHSSGRALVSGCVLSFPPCERHRNAMAMLLYIMISL